MVSLFYFVVNFLSGLKELSEVEVCGAALAHLCIFALGGFYYII